MFTGLVEDLGRVEHLDRHGDAGRLRVRTALAAASPADAGAPAGLAIGDSVAVNGACLTVARRDDERFEADLSEETLHRTALGELRPGDPVNLERSLRVGDRLGGHMVQGHVDGLAHLAELRKVEEGWELACDLPEELLDEVVRKGAIALDGVSLTVASLDDPRIRVAVVPHTAEHTNLVGRRVGDRLNVETDVVGKYVRRLFDRRGDTGGGGGGITRSKLEEMGFV